VKKIRTEFWGHEAFLVRGVQSARGSVVFAGVPADVAHNTLCYYVSAPVDTNYAGRGALNS